MHQLPSLIFKFQKVEGIPKICPRDSPQSLYLEMTAPYVLLEDSSCPGIERDEFVKGCDLNGEDWLWWSRIDPGNPGRGVGIEYENILSGKCLGRDSGVFHAVEGNSLSNLFWRNSPGYSWVKGIIVNPEGNSRAKGLRNSPGNSYNRADVTGLRERARPKAFAVRDPKCCAVVLSITTSRSTEKEALVSDDAYRAACWDCVGLPVEKKDREGKWFRLLVLEVPEGYPYGASPVPTARHLLNEIASKAVAAPREKKPIISPGHLAYERRVAVENLEGTVSSPRLLVHDVQTESASRPRRPEPAGTTNLLLPSQPGVSAAQSNPRRPLGPAYSAQKQRKDSHRPAV
ncbi:hypothetical protein B0H13DRAFT_2280592 [Mycena leptocephala]|nr:hypothetical protein B0H13DRAFT_2280592 [Mycena leptocephala]